MKNKIFVLFVTLLMCLSAILILPSDLEVDAAGGGEGDNDIGLDYDFMWKVTDNLTSVVHNAYNDGDIRKGRDFGSKGDLWTADYINDTMNDECGLSNVEKLKIEKIPGRFKWDYNYMVDTKFFKLTLHGNDPPAIDKNEIYPHPSGVVNLIPGSGYFLKMKYNTSFNNIKVVPINLNEPLIYDSTVINVDFDNVTEYNETIGNLTYVPVNGSLPNDHEARVFLLDEESDVDDKLVNISSNASAVLLIHNTTREKPHEANTTNCNVSVITRVYNNNSNVTDIINELGNGTMILGDNFNSNTTFRFSYNFNCSNWTWCNNDFFYVTPHRSVRYGAVLHKNLENITYHNNLKCCTAKCLGIIAYDIYDNTHLMWPTIRRWKGWSDTLIGQALYYWAYKEPFLQMFLVNGSIGSWLENNSEDATISGHFEQTDGWVDAYNVIGNITIDTSDGAPTTVISNRYDGVWSEAPGDSGAGAGIVLGIAKYFYDNGIKPKYNLAFLMTTGEEQGYRGAWHFSHSNPPDNYTINQWIGTDQLGFNTTDSYLNPFVSEWGSTKEIVDFIASETEYVNRTGYNYSSNFSNEFSSTDDFAIRQRSDNPRIINVHKAADFWPGHHRAGENYSEGDSLKYINRTDLNRTFEFAWNVTKYFCVNPDSWLDTYSITAFDSPNDYGDKEDSVNITYSLKTILPHDKIRFKAELRNNDSVVNSSNIDYYINSSGVQNTIIYTIPENGTKDYYICTLYLYNSTGRLNKILELDVSGNYYNETINSPYMLLHPWNSNGTCININNTNISATTLAIGSSSATISTTVSSQVSQISMTQVYISFPDATIMSYTMNNSGDIYDLILENTWQNGEHFYYIWAVDDNGTTNVSDWYSFNVSAMANVSICTIKDTYTGNETLNITDPPGPPMQTIGYELLDDNQVLHVWNRFDSYYFNTSNGVQFTNHMDEYWSHNVLMLGYYNNDIWNLIYRVDNLSGFNKNITSDNISFVNATLWKDLSYGGYDFHLAVRYHLGVDDNELTVIPYIKNIDDENITYTLGFAWEINNIQIDGTTGGDYIEINETSYYLNTTLDETYTNLTIPCYYIRENKTGDTSESLYLRWNSSLNYKVKVESKEGEYNAPVTLGIKIGTLNVGQEKYTSMFWHDAREVVYYFNSYDILENWATNPDNMVDGSISNYASTTSDGDVELCKSNTCPGDDLGFISKVELRAYGYKSGGIPNIILRPVFEGSEDGANHTFQPPIGSGDWSSWFDITGDPENEEQWIWGDIVGLDCDVESYIPLAATLYCSKVEVRVTYNPSPEISNPFPVDGSTGVSISPLLNITVSDPEGDTLTIFWLSNSSGSWQVFGTNSSVGNGTYYQNFSNANVNGGWWYWKVNVSDGIGFNESGVYKFYAGYQSKIENTGSDAINGYLLIQVQYYNTTSEDWVVANDTVNETSKRMINASEQLGLDTIFNPYQVNTSDLLSGFGSGTYRVYVAFRDSDGNVLVCDDETLMEASYEFTISAS